MKQLIARLKYFFTGKHDPMDLLNGVYHRNLPNQLTISTGMLKSDELAYEASDLVGKLYHSKDDNEFSYAQKLRRLPKIWGTLEAVIYYDSQVNNGGHEQYFANSEGAFLDLVEDGLGVYAEECHKNIFKRALFRYNYGLYAEYAYLDSTAEPNLRSPYHELDDLYYKASPKLPDLVDRFIRGNLSLYKRR